jgi:hypothetical protein
MVGTEIIEGLGSVVIGWGRIRWAKTEKERMRRGRNNSWEGEQ